MYPRFLILTLTALIFVNFSNFPVYGQITTPCSPSMISGVTTPCLNLLTGSTGNGNSPTADCCGALKSLTGGGLDCLCLILTAGIPFQIPINRTVAISLPRACNMPGVPVRCRANAAPLPAPGPVTLEPSSSPAASPSPKEKEASVVPEPSEAPESDISQPSPGGVGTGDGNRSSLPPSSAASSPSRFVFLFLAFGCFVLKFQ